MKRTSLRTKVLAGPLLIALILGGLALALNVTLRQQAHAAALSNLAEEASAHGNQLIALSLAMDTDSRSYRFTLDQTYLDQYDSANTAFAGQLAAARTIVGAEPAQNEQIDDTQIERIDNAAAAIQLWQTYVVEPTNATVQAGQPVDPAQSRLGNTLIARARTYLDDFITGETAIEAAHGRSEQAASDQATTLSIVAIALALILGLGASFWTIVSTLRPISNLADAVTAFGKRDTQRPLPAAGRDEIGDLVSAFAKMRNNLQANEDQLRDEQATLRTERNRLSTLLSTVNAGILATDMDGRITLVNPASERLLGTSAAEALGRPYMEVIHLPPGKDYALAQTLRDGQGLTSYPQDVLDAAGKLRTYLISTAALTDADGRRAGGLEVVVDVTEQTQISRELAARTAALEAKTAEQDTFLYTVSHDLKAPLVSIQGMAQLLTEEAGPRLAEDDRFYLSRITENVRHLSALLEDLLTLSRIGRVDTEVSAVSLAEIAEGAQQDLAVQLESRSVKLTIESSMPSVAANPNRLREAFVNLIDNAIKYTPAERNPEIRIGARAFGSDSVECWIEDNGVGINPEQRERVFGLFARLPDGKALHANGTGVGLAVVARIIQSSGGRIWIEDGSMGGTSFHMTLPAVPWEAQMAS